MRGGLTLDVRIPFVNHEVVSRFWVNLALTAQWATQRLTPCSNLQCRPSTLRSLIFKDSVSPSGSGRSRAGTRVSRGRSRFLEGEARVVKAQCRVPKGLARVGTSVAGRWARQLALELLKCLLDLVGLQ